MLFPVDLLWRQRNMERLGQLDTILEELPGTESAMEEFITLAPMHICK